MGEGGGRGRLEAMGREARGGRGPALRRTKSELSCEERSGSRAQVAPSQRTSSGHRPRLYLLLVPRSERSRACALSRPPPTRQSCGRRRRTTRPTAWQRTTARRGTSTSRKARRMATRWRPTTTSRTITTTWSSRRSSTRSRSRSARATPSSRRTSTASAASSTAGRTGGSPKSRRSTCCGRRCRGCWRWCCGSASRTRCWRIGSAASSSTCSGWWPSRCATTRA